MSRKSKYIYQFTYILSVSFNSVVNIFLIQEFLNSMQPLSKSDKTGKYANRVELVNYVIFVKLLSRKVFAWPWKDISCKYFK